MLNIIIEVKGDKVANAPERFAPVWESNKATKAGR